MTTYDIEVDATFRFSLQAHDHAEAHRLAIAEIKRAVPGEVTLKEGLHV